MITAALNIVFSWVSWQAATRAFDDKRVNLGWFMIFISAINFAAAMVSLGF
jgi:hypothetical protein